MKQKDIGIVLRKITYSENSLIATFFCQNSGLKSFIFQGGKKKKGNLLFPLSIVEFEFYSRPEAELGKITQVEPDFIPQTNAHHPIKSALLFFFAEILQQTIRQEEKDDGFFDFLSSEIRFFDKRPMQANYAIWFVLELTKWLGIVPSASSQNAAHMDAMNGKIVDVPENSERLAASGKHIQLLSNMLFSTKTDALNTPSVIKTRKQAMDALMMYYKTHIDGFVYPKSLEVLAVIWE